MAINSSPDKLEQNNPSDEVKDNLDSIRDDMHLFQRLLKIKLVSRESLNILMIKLKRRNEEKWDGNN